MVERDQTGYLYLDELLTKEHGWRQEWFYDVDPSPGGFFEFGPTSFHYGVRVKNEEKIVVFNSRVLDKSGRRFSTDIFNICESGRKLIFLSEPSDGFVDGYRPQEQYLGDMLAVGIKNSLFGEPLEIVGFYGETLYVRPENQSLEIDFSHSNKGVEEYYKKTGKIRFGAFLLLWHRRVIFTKKHGNQKRAAIRLLGNLSFWLQRKVKKVLLRSTLSEGCGGHPNYDPITRNKDDFCKRCDVLRTLAEDLEVLEGKRRVKSPWEA